MVELALYFILGGLFFCAYRLYIDRRYAHSKGAELEPNMLYIMSQMPDPEDRLVDYIGQSLIHYVTAGTGGRHSAVTTDENGQATYHGFRSKQRKFCSVPRYKIPANARLTPKGPVGERIIEEFNSKNGEDFNILKNNCRWRK